jgi:hypothetical protein
MLKRGFKPVPIFTRGEDPSVLNDYYKTSDVVGIGGLVGTPNNKGFVRGIMRYVGDRMVHWLGFVNMQFLRYYRPYMCDSSTWESAARYGSITLYMGNGKFKAISRANFQTSPEQAVLDRIRLLGLDPHVFARRASWAGGPSPLRALCARNGVALSVDLESALGTKQFLAITTDLALDLLTQGFTNLYSVAKS